jgi:YYY domain-containing protein
MSDILQIFIWWLLVQLIGLLALPAAQWIFRWLPARGYAFAKPLGLLLVSYVLWLGASAGFLRNDLGGILAALAALAAFSAWALRREGGFEALRNNLRENRAMILAVEALFTLALIAWAALRAYATFKIAPAGGEKFMEMAFLNAVLNSPEFPPLDPWLSGYAISYYYFGYVMMAVLTRLSGAAPGVGFDLYDALLFALTLSGAFGIVYNLVKGQLEGGRSGSAISYGLLGAALVGVMGNLEGLLESLRARGLLSDGFLVWIDIPDLEQAVVSGSWAPDNGSWFWWWRASRVIQDYDLAGNALGVSPITEFPFFSFLLGDNHPHKLALPFVLLAIALAFNLLRRQLSLPPGEEQAAWWNPLRAVFPGETALFLIYALCIGALGFLNTWDMPIYLGLATLAYGAGRWSQTRRLDMDLLKRSAALAVGLLLAGLLLYFYFYVGFSSQAGGILPYVFPPTRLPQYFVIFGVFLVILGGFLPLYLVRRSRDEQEPPLRPPLLKTWGAVVAACLGLFAVVLLLMGAVALAAQLAGRPLASEAMLQNALRGMSPGEALGVSLLTRLQNPWLFLTLTFLLALCLSGLALAVRGRRPGEDERTPAVPTPKCASSSEVFSLLLVLCGLALTLSTEFVYLRDVFGVRMNTIFKFYYQGWVLLALASAYALYWVSSTARPGIGVRVYQALCTLMIAAGMVYPAFGYFSRAEYFQSTPDLDGASSIASSNPDDWAAIEWLRAQLIPGEPPPVILEAPADQYDNYNYEGRISTFTGMPTLLGWGGHQSQWRGNYEEPARREPEIEMIYTTADAGQALDLLLKWNVDYVIVGSPELQYIQEKCTLGSSPCSPTRAVQKFDQALEPVFRQGSVTIYQVP